jgi:hypothetical protein
MPPHSETCHYSGAIDSWAHVVKPSAGFFQCGLTNDAPVTRTRPPTERSFLTAPPRRVPQFLYAGGTKRTQDQPPRNIHFESQVEVYEIPNVRELPKKQLAEMYMTRDEMSKIHGEAWEMVELMNLGIEYAETNSFSKRGLADLKESSVDRRRRTREQTYKIVFGMQSMHGRDYSPQIMAELYTQVSSSSKNFALRTAMYDAMAADHGK